MIEAVLYKHLQEQTVALEPYLATYCGKMAIFNQEAPADTDPGWGMDEEYNPDFGYGYEEDDEDEESEKESQYGRIVFALDLSEDPERIYSGTLAVDIQCENGRQVPEEMEPIVRELIDGYFFSTGDTTIAAQWSASNYFTEPTEKIVGVTLTFGLLAFPKQTTIEPDPIRLINKWTKEELTKILDTEITVIGHDSMEDAWKPTAKRPAIYWRLANTGSCNWIPDTYNCSWRTAVVFGHIIAPEKDVCGIIVRTIANVLTLKKRLIFEDVSPLMVDRNIRINLGNDEFRTGQITIDATYGILLERTPATLLMHPSVNGKEVK